MAPRPAAESPPRRFAADDLRAAMLADAGRGRLGVRVGAREALGIEPTLDAARERLRSYSLGEALELLGRMSAVLAHDRAGEDAQLRILAGLFGAERARAIYGRALRRHDIEARLDDRPPGPPPVLFDPRAVAATAVLAGATLAPSAEPRQPDPTALGEAILVVNDLLEAGISPEGADISTPDGRRRWTYYFAVAAFGEGTDPTVHEVVRAVELYLDPHDGLRESPDYVDLPALFEEATGLALDAYVLIVLALPGQMYGVTPENAADRSMVVGYDTFGGGLTFTREQRDRFFALAGLRAADFCARAAAVLERDAFRPFFTRPLEESPLVQFESAAVCASVPALERRLTRGIYHVLLNARRGDDPESRAFRARLQRFVGRAFEEYVERGARRMADRLLARGGWNPRWRRDGRAARYVSEAEMRAALYAADPGGPAAPLCDGALLVGRDLVLLETKARHFSLAARVGENPDDFFKRLDEITVGAARQLDATVGHLAAGRLLAAGLDPGWIRRVFPVSVSLEALPLSPEVRAWIDERVAAAGYLRSPRLGSVDVFPYEPLDVGDLEWLELAVERGGRMPGDLIAAKQATPVGHGLGLSTWGMATEVQSTRGREARLAHHAARWAELVEASRALLRAHMPPGADPVLG